MLLMSITGLQHGQIMTSVNCLMIVKDVASRAVQHTINRHPAFGNAVRRHPWQDTIKSAFKNNSEEVYWVAHGKFNSEQTEAILSDSDLHTLKRAGWFSFIFNIDKPMDLLVQSGFKKTKAIKW